MSSRGDGSLPEPVPGVRATDDDRLRVVERLRSAAGDGAIDLDELEQRIAGAYEARTLPELARLTGDLPAPSTPSPATPPAPTRHPALEDDDFRQHLTVFSAVIGMLVVIWLLTGAGHPWPVYPALAWGIGLASHFQVASTHQRKRLARAAAEGITLDELERREKQEKRSRPRPKPGRQMPPRLPTPPRLPPDPLKLLPPGVFAPTPAPTAPTTRFVVAMFVDVAGSTQLNEALGDEQWASVRRSFRDLVGEVIGGHGGWEANCTGDGVLARFEHPSAAADAACEILRRLERQRAERGFAPSVRIGIHSGDAVEEGDDIIGNVVNLAARVTDVADRDQVLVTEHVADHLDGRHVTVGRGLHTLKGVGRPRHLLALERR